VPATAPIATARVADPICTAGAAPNEVIAAEPSVASGRPSLSSSVSVVLASFGGIAKMMPPDTLPATTSADPPCNRSSASSFDTSAGAVA
jgi:hypothetical protein